MNIIPKISADFFSSKGNYKNYNARICMRIWNNAILFFLEFSKTYIPFASRTYRFIQKEEGRGEENNFATTFVLSTK